MTRNRTRDLVEQDSTERLPPQVKLFGVVSLWNDFASEMVYPLLPAFVTGVLGAGPVALGALDGAADFAAAGVKLGAGRLADRPGRRGLLVVAGYAVAVAVRPLIALAGAAWQVVGLRVTDRLGKGVRTPARDAIIADATPPAMLGRAFGLQRGLDHVGAVLGPLAAWALLESGTAGVRGVIAASIVPGVVVLALAWITVGRSGGAATASPVPAATSPGVPEAKAARPAQQLTTLFPIAAFHLLRMPETLVILWSQQLGVPIAAVPLLWAALHVVRAATSFVGGAMSDRVGAARTLWIGWAAYAAIAGGYALAGTSVQAWALLLALGVVAGLTEGPERALIASSAGGRQGSGFGAYHAATGVAALAGGLALGLVYQRAGGATALAASAGAGALLALVSPFVARGPSKDSRPADTSG